jgi:hypothetical protein
MRFYDMKSLLIIFFIITILFSCSNPPTYDPIPSIEFINVSKSSILENVDTTSISFSFKDGDGDLGPAFDGDTSLRVFLIDSRDLSIKKYQFPYLTPNGSVKAISGEASIKVEGFACSAGVNQDQLTYTIYIEDRVGHKSNSIQTTPINIDCQ